MRKYIKKLLDMFGMKSVAWKTYLFLTQLLSYQKWRALQKNKTILLELGSGPKKGTNGWVTVDISGADICHDLRKGIPLPADSVDRIYTSHMFEHIPYKGLVVFINECFRVLKYNGELSVCVPDASLYIKAYMEGKRLRGIDEGYKPAIVDTGSVIDQVNYIAYMDEQHKYMFDSENLVNTLKKAPFKIVKLRSFDESLDLQNRDFESIYASAIK